MRGWGERWVCEKGREHRWGENWWRNEGEGWGLFLNTRLAAIVSTGKRF